MRFKKAITIVSSLLIGFFVGTSSLFINAAPAGESWTSLYSGVTPGTVLTADKWNGLINAIGSAGASGDNIIARHSQTTSVPSCPTGWNQLWTGYSYLGGYLAGGYESDQDLGTAGSCLETFRPIPFIECGNPGSCDYYTGEDFSSWLSTISVDEGPVTGSNIISRISRCVVCERTAPTLVRHSFTTTVPSCPTGWNQLWSGYSFGGGYLAGGYDSGQKLNSPGSCLQVFRPIPLIECAPPNQCDYFTAHDFGMWMSTGTVDEGPVTGSNILSRISRCVVCSR